MSFPEEMAAQDVRQDGAIIKSLKGIASECFRGK
jgi:hypothetical protein